MALLDSILVPRGAEHRAVRRAVARAGGGVRVVAIPAGLAAGRDVPAAGGRCAILGLCGALDPALRVQDVVVCASAAVDGERLAFDAALTAALAERLGGARVGPALTVDRVVTTRDERAALRRRDADAIVEMEGGRLIRPLGAGGTALAMVRVVSDGADYDLPDLSAAIGADGELRAVATALAFLRAPRRALRFIREVRRALGALERTAARLAAP